MANRNGCLARRYSDQMICGACGLQWDVNDDDPPACKPKAADKARNAKRLNELRERLKL